MRTRVLLWASLGMALAVIVAELFWLGQSDLAWVILALAVAVALQGAYLLQR